MTARAPHEAANWNFFLGLPETDRQALNAGQVKDVQLLEPLFEFSGACAGCGRDSVPQALEQLFGDRAVIANATGCSSIYGGNQPTTPWTMNRTGGDRLGQLALRGQCRVRSRHAPGARQAGGVRERAGHHSSGRRWRALVPRCSRPTQSTEAGIEVQRARVSPSQGKPTVGSPSRRPRELSCLADALVKKSVWIVGGDGWAYDIGYRRPRPRARLGANVNVLVLDTEGLLQHGRPDVQVHPARCGGQVRRRRQAGREERPSPHGHDVWHGLRGPRGHGWQ
jgi:pyruvate-ferredoxin/flavodoxin oxidoreductase